MSSGRILGNRFPIDLPPLGLGIVNSKMSDSLLYPVPAPHLVEPLPSPEREGQVFWKLRFRLARSQLHYLVSKARLRTTLVIVLSALFWLGLFSLFFGGFHFVVGHIEMPGAHNHVRLMRFVFSLFFLSLMVMLLFSSAIIMYGGTYPSRETEFLLTMPLRDERLAYYRFQESLLFSSWGFFLLASPMLIAYGIVVGAPWYYYAFLPFLLLAFAYIPCGLGALLCLLVVNRLPRMRRIVVGVAAAGIIYFAYRTIWDTLDVSQVDLLGRTWFKQTFERFRFTRGEWLPSTWLSNALIGAARPPGSNPSDLPWLDSGLYFIVLVSNALMIHIAISWAGKRMLRQSYWNLQSRPARSTTLTMAWIDPLIAKLLTPFPRQCRLLILKDLRLFRRDPMQWSQFLIFFGLLLLYFANVDRFRQHRSDINVLTWVNVVSFLNLAVVGLILSTFTTRFIYPLLSLEGQRFWILSLLPVDRDTILWSKFYFAVSGSWLPCAMLVLVSDLMLRVTTMVILVHQCICLLLCLGLSGLAVGLGAILPNFREQSPSKIAAGFGGTLTLVLSALFIMTVVLLTALPCHFYLLAGKSEIPPKLLQPEYLRLWLLLGVASSIGLAALVTLIPLRMGLQAFRKLEV